MRLWVYNGFDILLTYEIKEIQEELLERDPKKKRAYEFAQTQQAVAFAMGHRGVLVDQNEVTRHVVRLEAACDRLHKYVQRLAHAVWNKGLNPNSPDQMKRFFYEMPSNIIEDKDNDGFGFQPIYGGKGKDRKITCDIKALEKIAKNHYYARPVVLAILTYKDLNKKIQFLKRGIDADSRFRCTFNVAGTNTGRWSSSTNPFGTGSNFQNLTDELRTIFIPDDGYIFGYPDLEQAESRGVAYLSGDEAYIAACEGGDLHTTVSRMLWPNEVPWTGELSKDKYLAEQPYYRHFSRRDLAKRGGHASNYLGTPWTLARNLQIEQSVAEEFQDLYFGTFSGIRRWHSDLIADLQSDGFLESPLGRKRTFFARRDSEETHKKAVASIPQGLISDIVKIGAWKIWNEFEIERDDQMVQVLADMHDGTVMQIKHRSVFEIIPRLIELMTIPVQIGPRVMTIPVDFTVGFRWTKANTHGKMVGWQKPEARSLTRPDPLSDLLSTEI